MAEAAAAVMQEIDGISTGMQDTKPIKARTAVLQEAEHPAILWYIQQLIFIVEKE